MFVKVEHVSSPQAATGAIVPEVDEEGLSFRSRDQNRVGVEALGYGFEHRASQLVGDARARKCS
jgi:hypothetical protein